MRRSFKYLCNNLKCFHILVKRWWLVFLWFKRTSDIQFLKHAIKDAIKVTKMQCIIKRGNSSLCTTAGAQDMEGGNAHQLLLSILWHSQQFQQLGSCFTLPWFPGSLCFPCSWRHLATADGWFSLTELLLTVF